MSLQTVDVELKQTELNEAGRFLIDTARSQERLYEAILSPDSSGQITATLWDNDGLGLDDTITVRVKSKISRAERMRQYGVEGLDPTQARRDERGVMLQGPQRDLIPTEEYIQNVIRVFGQADYARRWEIPNEIVRDVRRGKLSGAEAINQAGQALLDYLEQGQFEVDND